MRAIYFIIINQQFKGTVYLNPIDLSVKCHKCLDFEDQIVRWYIVVNILCIYLFIHNSGNAL